MIVINKLVKLSGAILSTIMEKPKIGLDERESKKIPEPEIFSTIYNVNDTVDTAETDINNNTSLESKYYLQSQIQNLFVVSREYKSKLNPDKSYYKYLVFKNIEHFVEYVTEIQPPDRNFHEVIFGWMPQRIKFDIDAYFGDMQELPEFFDKLADFIDAIVSTFYLMYYEQLGENDILITTSSGMSEKNGKPAHKCSYHIILNKYVDGADEAKNFTDNVIAAADPEFVKYIDRSVNKSLQMFRLLGCTKVGDCAPRYKTVTGLNEIFACSANLKPDINIDLLRKTLISGSYVRNFSPIVVLPKKLLGLTDSPNKLTQSMLISNEDVLLALKMAEPYMQDQIYRQTVYSGGVINLTRIRPGYCKICDVIHQSESSMIILAKIDNGQDSAERETESVIEAATKLDPTKSNAINVYFKCRRDLTKSILLGTIGENHKEIDRMDRFLRNPIDFKDRAIFATLPAQQRNVYETPQMANFEPPAVTTTLCVVAGMKMGKTKALKQYIAANFAPSARIVIVSFRQTFAADMAKKFPEMTLYSKVKGMLTQPRVIVQVESLHRLAIEAPATQHNSIDLLVLDESESILEQFDAKLAKNFNMVWENFRWLVKYAKNVVCMDAGMSSRTYTALSVIRAKPIFYHCNAFKNATQDKYFITLDKQLWYYNLFAVLSAGKRVVIPINTLAEAKVIKELIGRKFPSLRVAFYSSETLTSLKREHFSNVDEYWSACDVLIYTPTVSAGVSYECKHFDKVFPYMTDESCSVETCIQMIGRIRDVADKEFYVYISATGGRLPVTVSEIKRALYQSRDNLNAVFDTTHLTLKRTKDGSIKYHQSPYFHIWIENTRARNLSKNAFIQRFIYCVTQPGAKVLKMVEFGAELGCKSGSELNAELINNQPPKYTEEMQEIITEETKSVRRVIKNNEAQLVAGAGELTDVEVSKITEKIVTEGDISREEMLAFEKFKLRRAYNYGGEIDTDFILKYRDKRLISRFKNIKRVMQYGDVATALNHIQEEELLKYKEVMERDESFQAVDLKRTYTFDKHRIALGLLVLCGWDSITDPKTVLERDLHRVVAANAMKIYSLLLANQGIFGIKRIQIYCFKTAAGVSSTQTLVASAQNAPPDKSAVLGVLKYINGVIFQMYGVEIKPYKLDKTMYVLSKITDFDIIRRNIVTSADAKPNIFGTWCPPSENQVIDNTANPEEIIEELAAEQNLQPVKISMEEYLQNLFA